MGESKIRLVASEEDPAASLPSPTEVNTSTETMPKANEPNPADSVTISPSGVTLAELEAIALVTNPTLMQSQAAISAEQGFYVQAGLYPNPQVGYLNNSATRSGVENSNGMYYSQEIPTAKKLQLAQRSASVEIQRYSWDNESQRKRVLNDLKIRYYEVLGAQESLAVAENLVNIAEKIERLVEGTMKKGESSRADYLQADRHLQFARQNRDDAKDRLKVAWEQLATMVGCSPIEPVPLLDDLTQNIPQLDREICWQELQMNSPQLRSTECDLGHAVATYNEARAQAYPNVTLQVVSKYDTVTQAATISSLVALPLPVTNRNQGNIDKASADIIAAKAEITRVELVLHDQLVESFRRYQQRLRQTEMLKTSILPSVEESLEIAQRVYAKGLTTLAPVLAAQQEYSQSHVDYVDALTELHKAAVEIQGLQLTGGLNPAAIGSAIQNQPGGGVQRQRALLNEAQSRNAKQLMPAAQIAQ